MNEAWLILETSGRAGRVGLARGGAVVRAVDLDTTRRHARDLAPAISSLLALERLEAKALAGVMVSIGPGSYTGLRVGIISAKALAYATGCRLVAVPTFAAIAERAPAEAERLGVIGDALQDQIYFQRFVRNLGEGLWVPEGELRIEPLAEIIPRVVAATWLSGPAVGLVEDLRPATTHVVPEPQREPDVASLFRVGLRIMPATREELFALEPLYLRGSSAEEKAKREGQG